MPKEETEELDFKVREPAIHTIDVVLDGRTYEVRQAILVAEVRDTGLRHPVTGMPLFNIAQQVMNDVRLKVDA